MDFRLIGMIVLLGVTISALENSQIVNINSNVPRLSERERLYDDVPSYNRRSNLLQQIGQRSSNGGALTEIPSSNVRVNQLISQEYLPESDLSSSRNNAINQYQYQGVRVNNGEQLVLLAPRRRVYRQVGLYYPSHRSSSPIYPRYEINERSQYQAQGNAQNHMEGDYVNDRVNSQYQKQEQGAYLGERSRF